MVIKVRSTAPIDDLIRKYNIFILGRKIYGDFVLLEVSELDGLILKEELVGYL